MIHPKGWVGMCFRGRLLTSASAVAFGIQIAGLPVSAQTAAGSPEAQLPPVNIDAPVQKRRVATKKKAAPKAKAPATGEGTAAPAETSNVAAQTRQIEPASSASEQYRSGASIVAQPYARPGEFLETTPG